MAVCDFCLFPRLKTPLKGSHFDSHEDFVQKVTVQLHTIPKQAFQKFFHRWKDYWAKYVKSQRAYFVTTQMQNFVFMSQGQTLFLDKPRISQY
jgi:hypothetical protein